MPKRLVAVVTGATGGIGSALSQRLAEEGYDLLLAGRDEFRMVKLCHMCGEIRGQGQSGIVGYRADLSLPKSMPGLIAVIKEEFARIDLLVTCHAAPPCIKPSEDVTEEDWRTIWETDVAGTFRVCQAVGRQMLAQRAGCIINLTSIHAFASYPQRSIYASAKSAVVGFSRVLAIEWADRGVRVNCIAPGQVNGLRTTHIARDEETLERMRQRVPNRQFVQPEDVAATVIWLARTPSVNGQTVVLDHGLLASSYYEPYLRRNE